MQDIKGAIAWVTGAGSGVGEAAAIGLAREGAIVVLTGRRIEPLQAVAATITKAGGKAHVEAGDLAKATSVTAIAERIKAKFGRLDILVANAGLNINERSWGQLKPEGVDALIDANLKSAFYCATAVLPIMRAQKGGQIINVASMAGRIVGLMSGPGYVASKHGMVAMSHSINMEECVNGIRSCVICPGEIATPILDKRPVPVSKEDRARMLQAEDVAAMILHVAKQPAHVCVNEVQMTPVHNRGYIAAMKQPHVKV
jgi:NADP-dependent 3-hydroxy acid dehydrogenase YdfG